MNDTIIFPPEEKGNEPSPQTDTEAEKDSTGPNSETPRTDNETKSDDKDARDLREELRQLLREAEERGYKRGVNEQLRKALDEPQLFDDLARTRISAPAVKADENPLSSRFLQTIRPAVWD